MDLQELVNDILDLLEVLPKNLRKAPTNKAANQRVRVASIKATKLFKEYRKASVEYDKNQPVRGSNADKAS